MNTTKLSSRLSNLFLSRPYDLMMFAVCLAYTLTALPRLEITELFKNLILFGSLPVIVIKLRRREGNNQIFWLFLISLVLQIASWINSLIAIPDMASSHPEIKILTPLFLFVFMAFWVNGNRVRTILLYSCFIISFLATALYDITANQSLAMALNGERIDYGMHNAQFTSMLSVMVIMMTIYIVTLLEKSTKKKMVLPVVGAIIAFGLFSLLASQSRQVWLAALVIALILPLFAIDKSRLKTLLLTYLFALSTIAAISQVGFVEERMDTESGVIGKLLSGDLDDIPMTSIGIRVNSWIEATGWIKAHPILGTDRPSVSMVIKTSDKFKDPSVHGFGHLHNYYFDTLVSYGLLGLIFILVLYKNITDNIFLQQDNGKRLFLIGFLIFWAIINFFESYNTKTLGLYAQNILLAGLFFYPKPQKITNSTADKPATDQ